MLVFRVPTGAVSGQWPGIMVELCSNPAEGFLIPCQLAKERFAASPELLGHLLSVQVWLIELAPLPSPAYFDLSD